MIDPAQPAPSPEAILARAAQLIEERGLARGRRRGPERQLSAEGSLQEAFRSCGGSYALHGVRPVMAAERLLRRSAGIRGPIEPWSDRLEAADIIDAMRAAAGACTTA